MLNPILILNDSNAKDPKFKIGDHVIISKSKKPFC